MALLHDVDSLRELVKRLLLAELLARPGHGPLALRSAPGFRRVGRAPAGPSAPVEPPARDDEP